MRSVRLVGRIGMLGGLGVLVLLGASLRHGLPRTWSGQVAAFEPGERRLVLAVTRRGGHGESLALSVTPTARIQRFNETREIRDVAPGQLVDVTTRHRARGSQEATTIRIRGGPDAAGRESSEPTARADRGGTGGR